MVDEVDEVRSSEMNLIAEGWVEEWALREQTTEVAKVIFHQQQTTNKHWPSHLAPLHHQGKIWKAIESKYTAAKTSKPPPHTRTSPMANQDSKPITIDELEAIAKQKLPSNVYNYYSCGSDDQKCLKRNRDAFDWYEVLHTLKESIHN